MSATPETAALPPNPVARRVAYLGLLPFAIGAALVWIVRPEVVPYVSAALSAVAGATAAWLGGIHWGLAFRQRVPSPGLFVTGALPAVVAAIAWLMPAHAGLVVHGLLIAGTYAVDRKVYRSQGVAAWLKLRFRVSALASLCCFLGAAGA